MSDILAIGEPMVEFNAESMGAIHKVSSFLPGFGGDTSNTLVAISRLGASAGMITRLGDDPFGDAVMEMWGDAGVDTRLVGRSTTESTGIYFIHRDDSGHHFTYYRKGSAAAAMTPAMLDEKAIGKAKILHASGISQAISESACDTVFAAMKMAKEAGTTVSYDPNLRLKLWPLARARAVINQAAALSDIFLPSLEDAQILTGCDEPDEIVEAYLAMGPSIVALKLGSKGCLVARQGEKPSQFRRMGVFKVDSIDMSGAGDTFDGGFLTAFSEGKSLTESARFAAAAAALTTTGLGAVGPIPTREKVDALMAS
ncbi:MAG: sugar kinase [Desulfobacterales bacterium]|nr:sugar kinase [Desulfobacterales bacterium]